MNSIDSIGDRFVFNGCFRGTRIETGIVHPKDAIVLSRLAYIATSDFPLGRSSVQERPEENRELLPKNLLKLRPLLHSARAFLTIRIFSRSFPSFHRHLTFQEAS